MDFKIRKKPSHTHRPISNIQHCLETRTIAQTYGNNQMSDLPQALKRDIKKPILNDLHET